MAIFYVLCMGTYNELNSRKIFVARSTCLLIRNELLTPRQLIVPSWLSLPRHHSPTDCIYPLITQKCLSPAVRLAVRHAHEAMSKPPYFTSTRTAMKGKAIQ
jgi:hypothetical protein